MTFDQAGAQQDRDPAPPLFCAVEGGAVAATGDLCFYIGLFLLVSSKVKPSLKNMLYATFLKDFKICRHIRSV